VFLLITLAPKLGAAPVVACVVLGQILCSVIIDHYGLLGFELHPVSLLRAAGIVLLVAGVAMIRLS
jgi:transporter family-2 protein